MKLKSFGREIKRLRDKSGISQRKLAEEASIAPSYLCKIERGVASYFPSDRVVEKLSKVLAVDSDALMAFSNKIPKEAYEDYIYLVKKYPEIIDLLKEMVKNPRFAEEIIAQVKMKYLL
ncbi:MAG: helix-turn-helix domain-containing protein [Okeania sp. SIO1H6]|nr:helix-turn-helix domain-containing protein [Okeania sp. SIO1H6]